MKKVIVFDFDGTLADTISIGIRLFNDYSAKFGYKKVSIEQTKTMSLRQLLSLAKIKIWKLPLIIFFLRRKMQGQFSQIQLFEGIPSMLKRLNDSGFELGILSSNSKETISKVLQSNQVESYFSFIKANVSAFGKAHAITALKEKLNCNIIYIGDELRDIKACNCTNTPIVSVSWGMNSYEILEKSNPNSVARTSDEVFEKVQILA
ncbi:MAG: HAD-IA family hydrolase [Treponema sp.]|nr:HAD-IA family hydrolase [Treponema sp.]